jgi:hypothetical protein
MTGLNWRQIPGGEQAHGTDWTYLITHDDWIAVLTRFQQGPDYWEIARQAALNAIQLGGGYRAVPEVAADVVTHLKQTAQLYEAGTGITGYPAWWPAAVPR